MEEKEYNLLIVGLPEAGKTSFIHAVDDLMQNPPIPDALRSYRLAHERSYLERDKEKFRAGKKLEHTERNLQGAQPELWFEHPKTGRKGRLFLPDMSGEVFQDQWAYRRWSKSYRDDLKTIGGILVFVRADSPASNQELLGQMATLPANVKKALPWDPKKASPQVQLVDVLQFIAAKGQAPVPLQVAVMISAWDTVSKPANLQPKNPNQFLAREWPLLDQYLRANPETFVTKIYGVSALGGTEEELKELSKLRPQDRVQLVEDAQPSRDLTRPLRWLLNLD
jgi:double-GTPase-like protein